MAVFAVLGAVALTLAQATPVRGMGVSGETLGALTVARPAALALGAASVFGIDEGGVLVDNPTGTSLAAATGVNWTRIEVSWASIENTPGTYDWTATDRGVLQMLNAGLNPIVYVSDNPQWAANTGCGPLKDADKVTSLGNLMGALASRYPTVKVWALYNEVDDAIDTGGAGCFGSLSQSGLNKNNVPDYQDYAVMLATAWSAVHGANPSAQLAVGAIAYDNFSQATCPPNYSCAPSSPFSYSFLPNLLSFIKNNPLPGGNKYMDAMIFNYYDVYGIYWQSVAKGVGIQAKAEAIRNQLRAKQLPVVDLYVTETGEDSSASWVGLTGQAHCLTEVMTRGAAAGLKGVVWWTFEDQPPTAPPPMNTWRYGIVDDAMTPKPSYAALQTLTTELNNYTFNKTFSNKKGYTSVEAYRFKSGKSKKFVVLSSSIMTPSFYSACAWARNPKLVTFKAKSLRVVDYLGGMTTIADNSKQDKDKTVGSMAIKVAGDPKIVTINP